LLVLAACAVLTIVVALWTDRQRQEFRVASAPQSTSYRITHGVAANPAGTMSVDGSVQFVFPDYHATSPGSLIKMTVEMHHSEIEIATRLAREIKFSR
jgi:hypothetical protein